MPQNKRMPQKLFQGHCWALPLRLLCPSLHYKNKNKYNYQNKKQSFEARPEFGSHSTTYWLCDFE